MYRRTVWATFAIVPLLVLVSDNEAAGAVEDESVQGRIWYENQENPEWSMDLELVEGVVVPTELQGGERVRVLLVGEPLDQEKFMAAMEETGNTIFAAMRLQIRESVSFDVCRNEDGSGAEICGISINGPGLSKSESGFGVYGHFTELISFEGGRVKAKLETPEPIEEGNLSYGLDLSFDLPITNYERK